MRFASASLEDNLPLVMTTVSSVTCFSLRTTPGRFSFIRSESQRWREKWVWCPATSPEYNIHHYCIYHQTQTRIREVLDSVGIVTEAPARDPGSHSASSASLGCHSLREFPSQETLPNLSFVSSSALIKVGVVGRLWTWMCSQDFIL